MKWNHIASPSRQRQPKRVLSQVEYRLISDAPAFDNRTLGLDLSSEVPNTAYDTSRVCDLSNKFRDT